MSIIITGLEIPTERESFNLTIKYNGTVLDTETEIQVAEAYELPPHGRLIDADALFEEVYKVWGTEYDASECNSLMGFINEAPTIIPAEPCNNRSKPCKEEGK